MAERFQGALLGCGLGDAVGAGWEGQRRLSPTERIANYVEEVHKLRYTDDTAMTIGVAESLIACKGFDGAHMSQQFITNFRLEPNRGYGPGPPHVLTRIEKGASWRTASLDLYPGGSYGNGAAMRAAPIGLFYRDTGPDQLRRVASEMAHITHAHPLGKEGAALQAYMVALASHADSAQSLDRSKIIHQLQTFAQNPIYQEKIGYLEDLLENPDPTLVVQKLGHGIAATDSVVTAIFCFLHEPNEIQESILYAVSLGGDTDTIAAMTGAIVGAFLGSGALPKNWLSKLENYHQILSLANALFTTYKER